jgi:hypothetical protein
VLVVDVQWLHLMLPVGANFGVTSALQAGKFDGGDFEIRPGSGCCFIQRPAEGAQENASRAHEEAL